MSISTELTTGVLKRRIVIDSTQIAGYSELSVNAIKSILQGKDLANLTKLYRLMITKDSHISSELKRRKSRIRGQQIILTSSNKTTQDTLNTLHSSGFVKRVLSSFLTALDYGFFVGELWYDNNLNLTSIDQTVIQNDYLGVIFVNTATGQRITIDDTFFTITNQEQPIIQSSALYSLIYLFVAKHFVLGNYLKFAEMLGVPPVIINTANPDDVGQVALNTMDLKSGGIGVYAKDDVIKILEGKGSQADFLEFIKYCDQQISVHINGNTLSSTSDGKGSLALGKVHENSQQLITQEDCYFFADELERFLKIKLRLEGFVTDDINVAFQFAKTDDQKTKAETYQILVNMGIEIDTNFIQEEFGLPITNSKTGSQTKSASLKNAKNENSSAQITKTCTCCSQQSNAKNSWQKMQNKREKEVNAITQAMYDQLDFMESDTANTDELSIHALDFMVDALGSCQSYQEALNLTIAAFGTQPLNGFTELVQNAVANSALAGMADVQAETGTKP
jgi:phage gp29-like protein